MTSRRAIAVVVALVLLVGIVLVGRATRPSEQRVALAIHEAVRPHGTVIFTVECATDIEVRQAPDPAGSGLTQVTVWGRPKVGRCDPSDLAADNDLSSDTFVDGATSQVVHVQHSCLPTRSC
ncbi:MAG: hypothetical protein U0P45_06525 [Acidimicrobiales bacterium]